MFSQIPLFCQLPTPLEMNEWDTLAQTSFGIPAVVLMENASQEALRVLASLVPLSQETEVLIFAGHGNNGGDGFAMARHLHDLGCQVLVCHMGTIATLKGPAKEHAIMAQLGGVNLLPISDTSPLVLPHEWHSPHIVIDAISGTGLKGGLREQALSLVRTINSYKKGSFVFSLDSPTGLCGLTGFPLPEAVFAHATVTFEAAKPGLCFPQAKKYTGELFTKRIGIPSAIYTAAPASWQLLSPRPSIKESLPFDMHKGTAGAVCIIGGCEAMSGAPFLSALGALRAGAGLVHVLCPEKAANAIRPRLPEAMVHGIGKGSAWEKEHGDSVIDLLASIQPRAMVIGPGMGKTDAAKSVIRAILKEKNRSPAVIDADALDFFCLTGDVEPPELAFLQPKDTLTPHPGELSRILPLTFFLEYNEDHEENKPVHILQKHRASALSWLREITPATVVLKGAGTLIGQQTMPTTLCPIASPSLAIAGSGDVLSGVIAALTAVCESSFRAASLGVHLHARAGQLLDKIALRGHLASEIALHIPYALQELLPSPASSFLFNTDNDLTQK